MMNSEIWDERCIMQMISDGIEESIHLDYKGAGSLAKIPEKKSEILKDVTAFANSDGGVIIYGVREFEEKDRKHLPSHLDPIDRSIISKEWLEQIISNAAPRIHGIRIHPVQIGATHDRCAYVIDIPKSETAHQASDGRYYRRYNFESVFMRDHEVRDVMNRSKVPRIEVDGMLKLRPPWEINASGLLIRLRNVGSRIANRYICVVRIPALIEGEVTRPTNERLIFDEDAAGCYYRFSLAQNLHQTPLFPKGEIILRQDLTRGGKMTRNDGSPLNHRKTIEVQVFADEMEAILLEINPALLCQDTWVSLWP